MFKGPNRFFADDAMRPELMTLEDQHEKSSSASSAN
jgi:hypothetical protein